MKGVAVIAGGGGLLTVALTEGALATTSIESNRLTPEEAIAAGIDPTDPDNINLYEFEIYLAFIDIPIAFTGYVSEGGGFSGASFGGGGGKLHQQFVHVDDGREQDHDPGDVQQRCAIVPLHHHPG
jgi:hypothetical protein